VGSGDDPYTQLIFQIDLHGTFVIEAGDEIATEGRKSRCGDLVGDVCGGDTGLSGGSPAIVEEEGEGEDGGRGGAVAGGAPSPVSVSLCFPNIHC
jgi:hypothetical protein